METTTTKILELEFLKKNGLPSSLSFPDYKEDLTEETIKTVGATIIEKNIFETDGYEFESLSGYQYVDKTVRKTEF
ncbi:MAG: DUF2922 domain-containing protein [Eubacterium sp.]